MSEEPMNGTERLVLEIEIPGYNVEGIIEGVKWMFEEGAGYGDFADAVNDELENSMHLATDQVGITFATREGDSPALHMQTLLGRIVRRRVDVPQERPA